MASIEQTVPTRIASPEDTINLPPGFGKSVFGQGEEIGSLQDFAAGWRREDGSTWGRPVDVLTGRDGSLLISDDGQGFIYRGFFEGEQPP